MRRTNLPGRPNPKNHDIVRVGLLNEVLEGFNVEQAQKVAAIVATWHFERVQPYAIKVERMERLWWNRFGLWVGDVWEKMWKWNRIEDDVKGPEPAAEPDVKPGAPVGEKDMGGYSMECPECSDTEKQEWLSTTNEWKYHCPKCDNRYNAKGEIMPPLLVDGAGRPLPLGGVE